MGYVRIAANALLIFIFLKFFSEISWLIWILIYLASDIADSVSTSIASAFGKFGWAAETNPFIQNWGPSIGFNTANYLHLAITSVTIFALSYFIGFFLPAFINFILFWHSVAKFECVLHNFIFMITDIDSRSLIHPFFENER